MYVNNNVLLNIYLLHGYFPEVDFVQNKNNNINDYSFEFILHEQFLSLFSS